MTDATTQDAAHRALAEGRNRGLEDTYLVEAGAGTGKTSVLITRLLSLVSEGTELSRIVAITFTEKAAGELRARLRGALEAELRSGRAGPDGALLEKALHEIDRAHIGTIHGFCSDILRERPVEAGVDPDFAMADELRQVFLFEEVWETWIRSEFAQGLPPAVAEAHALGYGLRRIRELASRLVSFRDLLDLVPGPVDAGGAEAYIAELQREAEEFVELARTECSDPGDSAVGLILAFAEQARAIEHVAPESRVAFALRDVKPAPPSNRGRKANWSDGILEDVRARAAALKERRDEVAADLAHNAAVELLTWLRGYVDAYEETKLRLGLLDFEDLLIKARDVVRDNFEVRDHFKRAFARILVDEFQDTDPLQCEIAFFLAEKEGGRARDWKEVELEPGKLFLVGDPKQSIYRFRRADIEIYEEAKRHVGGEALLELIENFRTRPPIIDEVNAVFESRMVPPESGRRYQPDYAPLVPHRKADGQGPGVVILTPGGPLEKGTGTDVVREAEAASVAAFIAKVRDERSLRVYDRALEDWRPVELKDVAILFHSMTGLDVYEQALRDFGLEYRIAGGKKFYTRREVKELATVLAAVEDPHDEAAVVGALRSPFFGASDEDILLHRWRTGSMNYLTDPAAEGDSATIADSLELLRLLHAYRNGAGPARLLTTLFEETKALELFLMKPSGEQRHANLLKVVELAEALEKSQALSFGGFVRWLRDVSQLTPEEAESPLSEEGDDFIRVLTIHKAKGLEFPVTVLADVGRLRKRLDRIIVDRAAGRLEFGVSKSGTGLATRGYRDMIEFEEARRDAESLRLLYVGMTRARDTVVVPWFLAEGGRSGPWFLEQLEPLLERAGEPVVAFGDKADWGGNTVAFDTRGLDITRKRQRPIRLKTEEAETIDASTTEAARELAEWYERRAARRDTYDHPEDIRSPSRLDRDRPEPAEFAAKPPTPATADESIDGRELGTLVHDVMERIDLSAPGNIADVARALARPRGMGDATVRVASELIVSALSTPVIGRARAAARSWRELPFCLESDGVILEGKIDLVFEEEDGLVVVDYKTDEIGAGSAADLAARYDVQARSYGLALAAVTGRCVKEVVLVFMREPTEERIDVADACASPDEARHAIAELLSRMQAAPE
jgi:ATP-dependent exoDNAse (exonuclease V) beta subunit